MKPVSWLLGLLATLGACAETPSPVPLRSLERSGDVAFLCLGGFEAPRSIEQCPDYDDYDGEERHLFAMVTQTARGELAMIDVSAGKLVDSDPAMPGINFYPVGAQPIDVVTTPGGTATFVAVTEVGREGIYALPSGCLAPRTSAQVPANDLTLWPACALPSAPGRIEVVVDEANAGERCPGAEPEPEPDRGGACPAAADLGAETGAGKRLKLLVTLPDLGQIVILDAQTLLDRQPGSYDACPIDRAPLALAVDLPSAPIQQLAPDLDIEGSCRPDGLNHGPLPDHFQPRPAGVELVDDLLYVADQGAPVIHRIDLADPCAPVEQPPLLPVSFTDPGSVVTTTELSVSPPLANDRGDLDAGDRFAYAIDEKLGSVMLFDVTPGASNRTPLVRKRSQKLPFEPPDRIAFASPARDVELLMRDVPNVDPTSGVATIGRECDPDPRDDGSVGASYRPNGDYTSGAAPRKLRGVFGFIALSSGQIAVIDVQDFDAPCRRPITPNYSTEEDSHGCVDQKHGASPPAFFTAGGVEDGDRTVTGEVSCQVVEPHRSRSGTLLVNAPGGIGVRAPSLRSAPRLSVDGSSVPTNQTDAGKKRPKLLAVPFAPGAAAEVYVAGTRLVSDASEDASNKLDLTPATAEQLSVAHRFDEPRAFPSEEDLGVTYEGQMMNERPAGFLTRLTGPAGDELRDGGGSFCGRGVQDFEAVRQVGRDRLKVPAGDLDEFAKRHADYLQITSDFPAEEDEYWKSGLGASCGDIPGAGYDSCRSAFGPGDKPIELRDLRITEAYQSTLMVEPRVVENEPDRQRILDLVACCFPAAISYTIRAGHQWVLVGSETGFRHDMRSDSDEDGLGRRRCIHDCSPLRQHLVSRAFEISCSGCAPSAGDTPATYPVGPAVGGADFACTREDPAAGVAADDPCVFENLTTRYAIYRGNEPSRRDMVFGWQTIGGFNPLYASLAAATSSVSPESMVFVPQIGQLAIADGASAGLVFVGLDSVSVSRLFF